MSITNIGVVGSATRSGSGIHTIDIPIVAPVAHGDPTTGSYLMIATAFVGDYGGNFFAASDDALPMSPYYEYNQVVDNLAAPSAESGSSLSLLPARAYIVRTNLSTSNTLSLDFVGSSFSWIGARLHHMTGIRFNTPTGSENLSPFGVPVNGYGGGSSDLSSTTFVSPFGGNFDGTSFMWQGMVTRPKSPDTSSFGDICAFEPPAGPNSEQHSWETNSRHAGYWFRQPTNVAAQHKFYFTPTSPPKTRNQSGSARFYSAGPGEPYVINPDLSDIEYRAYQ